MIELNSNIITIETTFTKGLPFLTIVGLATNSIQESKERVKSSLSCIDFKLPSLKVTINLSPSDISKDGTHFDLAIALLIYMYSEDHDINMSDFYTFNPSVYPIRIVFICFTK